MRPMAAQDADEHLAETLKGGRTGSGGVAIVKRKSVEVKISVEKRNGPSIAGKV